VARVVLEGSRIPEPHGSRRCKEYPQDARTYVIKRFTSTLVLILLFSLLGIAPIMEARRAAIGISPYSAAEKFVESRARQWTPPDGMQRVTIEVPVDQRMVRRSVDPPTVESRTSHLEKADRLTLARSILASRIAMYPMLEGSTVEFGDTGGNPQAICYYKSARIVINPNYTVSLERIIDHEIWHIIDWRDNGQIDWGESVPPENAAEYR
jgi:hypothetical protein